MMTLNEVKQALANGEDVDCMPYYKQLLKNSETSYSARYIHFRFLKLAYYENLTLMHPWNC